MSVFLASFCGSPLPIADYWLWLVFPICLSVSVVYKTTKARRFADIFPTAAILFISMIASLAGLTMALWLLSRI